MCRGPTLTLHVSRRNTPIGEPEGITVTCNFQVVRRTRRKGASAETVKLRYMCREKEHLLGTTAIVDSSLSSFERLDEGASTNCPLYCPTRVFLFRGVSEIRISLGRRFQTAVGPSVRVCALRLVAHHDFPCIPSAVYVYVRGYPRWKKRDRPPPDGTEIVRRDSTNPRDSRAGGYIRTSRLAGFNSRGAPRNTYRRRGFPPCDPGWVV